MCSPETWGTPGRLLGANVAFSCNQGIYSWEQARNYCRTFFTDLVAIQNKEEIGYLNATLPFHKQYYWIGIRKQNSVWTWVGTNKALTKEAENWAKGEPNNRRSNQDCVEIYIKRQQEAGKWNDEPCHKRKTALCYKASCQASTCRPHGECVEVIESYRCECHPGFEGDECDTAVQCPTLNPKGARMTCSHPFGDFRYNSTCDFVCPEGFERRGAGTLQCLASRQWSAETPTCAGRDCRGLGLGVLPPPSHPSHRLLLPKAPSSLGKVLGTPGGLREEGRGLLSWQEDGRALAGLGSRGEGR
uniref:p-selectin n=1 Tax=Anser cygnoides TaxID=8845 RepID=A0A8B9EM14_ANSCY